MKACFEYKGYLGSAEVSLEDNVLHGRVLYINDLITYEAQSPKELETEFKAAVDDYLITCQECGDEPDVPFKGSFNVRLGPETHRDAALAAERDGVKLNEWVKTACLERLSKKPSEQHNHLHQVNITFAGVSNQEIVMATAGGKPTWKPANATIQ